MVALRLCRGLQIEQCGGTTKAPLDKGGETVERSSAVALNGVDSLSLPDLVIFSFFCWGLDDWVFFMFVFESHVSDMCLFH